MQTINGEKLTESVLRLVVLSSAWKKSMHATLHACNNTVCILFNLMPSMQLEKKIMQWMDNWLMDRAHAVLVPGAMSDWQPVTSGVQQGCFR